MIPCLLLALAHGGADPAALAYPIDPWTLRMHVQHADLLAIAVPGKTTPGRHAGCEGHFDCDSTTTLTIRKVLRGSDPGKSVVVGTCQAVICPADAEFPEGGLLFVSLDRTGGSWHSTALSYGAMPITEPDVAVLERFVKEYERILGIKDAKERRKEEVEWIVRLVEYPLTSWQGALELNAGRYLPVGSSTWENYARDLSPEQWERLTVVLLAGEDWQDDLLEVVRDRRDPRVLAWYLDRIEATADRAPWNIEEHLYWFCGVITDEPVRAWVISTWRIEVRDRRGETEIDGMFQGKYEAQPAALRAFVTLAREALLPE